MSNISFLFRADNKNVGDWWCPPFRYFPFKPGNIGDVLNINFNLSDTSILIIGGGGIGSEYFRPHLKRIESAKIQHTVLWGGGVDAVIDISKILSTSEQELYGDYFNFIDDVGIRVFSEEQKFRYVPCASCMNNLFFKYRDTKPSISVGYYNHKDLPLIHKNNEQGIAVEDNSGIDLEEKLKFLSRHEYIVTNTYHGAYWATLLERKVVVVPFKSGLFSFKNKPVYCWDGKITDDVLHSAKCYRNVLEESRKLNLEFFNDLKDKLPIV